MSCIDRHLFACVRFKDRDMCCDHVLQTFRKSGKKGNSMFFKSYRPLSHGGHFESQEDKKLCFCTSSLALDERLDVQKSFVSALRDKGLLTQRVQQIMANR